MTTSGARLTDPYRWTVAEYVLRCESQTIDELLVEGECDRDFFADTLARYGVEVTVRDASYVTVAPAEIDAAGFARGVRGGLLTLAAAIQRRFSNDSFSSRVAIVVDRDYDGPLPHSVAEVALVTDGYSLENYTMDEAALDRFLLIFLGRSPRPLGRDSAIPTVRRTLTGRALRGHVLPACVELGAARKTLRRLDPSVGLPERWLDMVKVNVSGAAICDAETLVGRALGSPRAIWGDVLDEERAVVSSDPVRYVKGHDYIMVLHKILKSTWGRSLGVNFAIWTESRVNRVLLLALDRDVIDALPLFISIKARFT